MFYLLGFFYVCISTYCKEKIMKPSPIQGQLLWETGGAFSTRRSGCTKGSKGNIFAEKPDNSLEKINKDYLFSGYTRLPAMLDTDMVHKKWKNHTF